MSTPDAVTFVVPVLNGARWLDAVLRAILAQRGSRPIEVIAVDDGSTDRSAQILDRHEATGDLRVLRGPRHGAAAAINLGIRHARHALICQIDQDVVLGDGWLDRATREIRAPDVAAVQGYYATPPDASVWARAMGRDLELRYQTLSPDTDHVCTGNVLYRAGALHRVGLFDEALGYGYDNDMSYRLAAAGYRLVFCRDAVSVHHWRGDAAGYVRQQYGVGYGRLDVVARHPRRATGDRVSGPGMIAHAVAMLVALGVLAGTPALTVAGLAWQPAALTASVLVGGLAVERAAAGVRAAIAFRDPSALAFVPIHLVRDTAWAAAIVAWAARRALRRPARAVHSMRRA